MPPALTNSIRFAIDRWPWLALLTSILMLAMAHFYFQDHLHLAPCLLCLKQREAYWAAIPVAAAAIAAGFTPWRGILVRLLCVVLAGIFLYGMGIAVWHMGAEYKWWPGPKACALSGPATLDQMAALMRGDKIKAPSCEEPVWWFPNRSFGLTMAGWNVLISLKLAVWSIMAAFSKRSRP
jgi:disulfide bond formation protein DsbB